jgi:hypothetical protein
MTKLLRAIEIHNRIRALDAAYGRWETVQDLPGVRVRVVDAGLGWNAHITTPFSEVPAQYPDPGDYGTAVSLREHLAGLLPNTTDLYLGAGGKVMCVEWSSSELKIITFTPGPWESAFGLPSRSWPNSASAPLKASWTEH